MMGRPSDWSLLGGTDPCPGNVEDTQAVSAEWGKSAGTLNDGHSVLAKVHIEGAGQAVSAGQRLIGSSAALIGVYRGACENCANALTSWASSLSSFQDEADRLHAQAQQADDERAAGQRMIAAGREERIREASAKGLFEGISQAAIETLLPGLAGNFSDTRGHAMIADANARLSQLRSEAEELRARYRAEGDRISAGVVIPEPSDVMNKAGLSAETPIGDGALVMLLNSSKDPKQASLNNLYDKANKGDTQAQNDYLIALAALTPTQLALYSVWQQAQARNPLAAKNDVPVTKAWWAGLGKDTQALLIAAMPGLIGNLNGVPYTTRDKANRTLMNVLRKDPKSSDAVRNAIQGIDNSLVDDEGNRTENRFVVSYDLNNGKPLAAVAIGNLDTAGNVTWNIPGMGTTVAPGGIDNWTIGAQSVYDQQLATFDKLGPLGVTNAVVSWVGYETPGMFPGSMDVFSGDQAWSGSDKLASALDGYYDTRNDGNIMSVPKVNIVAHSYGTTTAAYALTKTAHNVNTVTFIASAGIDANVVPNASAMHVAAGSDDKAAVYATQASGDLIAPLGITGSRAGGAGLAIGDLFTNPVGAVNRYFDTVINQKPIQPRVSPIDSVEWPGARVFSSEGGIDPTTGAKLEETNGHQTNGSGDWSPTNASTGHGYLDSKTESLQNIALASTGNGDKIRPSLPFAVTTDHGTTPQQQIYPSRK